MFGGSAPSVGTLIAHSRTTMTNAVKHRRCLRMSPLPLAGEVGLSGPREGLVMNRSDIRSSTDATAPSPAAETATSPPKGGRGDNERESGVSPINRAQGSLEIFMSFLSGCFREVDAGVSAKLLFQFFDAKISEQDITFRAFVDLQAEESFRVSSVVDPVSGRHTVDPCLDDVAFG
jgi:hypothetical protein